MTQLSKRCFARSKSYTKDELVALLYSVLSKCNKRHIKMYYEKFTRMYGDKL